MQTESQDKVEVVFDALKERILKGVWPIGGQIPTELGLATEFNCHRSTISKALTRLAHEQLVERRRRTGTRVIRNTLPPKNSQLQLNACAFVYPSNEHEGIWQTVRGFEQAAAHAEQRVLMLSTGSDFRREAEIVGRLGEFDVKGAALFPVVSNPHDEIYYRQMILSCPFPVVLVELNLPGIFRPSVTADGVHAGYSVTRYLLGKGLTKIGFMSNYSWAPFMRDRYLGYRQAMREAGLDQNEAASLVPEMKPDFKDPIAESLEIAREFLTLHRGLEGVVCASDFLATGLIAAAKETGLRIPEEMKVTGIGGHAIPGGTIMPLTTYQVPYEEMGRRAFQTLQACLEGASPNLGELQVCGRIIPGNSA